jgi:hypothetical protein
MKPIIFEPEGETAFESFRHYILKIRRITDTPEGVLVAVLKGDWRSFPDITSWREFQIYLRRRHRKSAEEIRVVGRGVWRSWLDYARHRRSDDPRHLRRFEAPLITRSEGSSVVNIRGK